jgi:hypothetical protein
MLNIVMQIADLKKIFLILVFFSLFSHLAFSQQLRFSVATDLSVQRSFKKGQQYWALGQTVHAHFHLTPKEGIYVWFAYYSNGKYNNNITATAKSAATVPQQIAYVNSGNMRLKQFSTGWKKYLKGSAEAEKDWNLYVYAGFGLLLGRVENTHSVDIDTATYNVPVWKGRANFKRLTLDPGLGFEKYLGGDFYIYAEGRVWVPTDGYPSQYIYVNEHAPWTGMLNVGLRILF